MKYPEFTHALRKGSLKPVYFFSGEEAGLIEEGVRLLLDKLVTPESRDFNFDVFYASDVSARRVLDIAASYPMMAPHRTVLVRDINKMAANDLQALAEYAKRPAPTTYLILTQREKISSKKSMEALRLASAYVECRPLYDNHVVPWIQEYVERLGMTIAPEAAQLLATEVGNAVASLRSEIEKIQLYLGEQRHITLEHAQNIAGFRREFSVFALQDAIGEKKLREALRIVENLAAETGVGAIINTLARYFCHLYIAKALPARKDLSKLSEQTGVHSFFAERLQKAAAAYDHEALFNAFEVLQHVDYLSKSQNLPQPLLLRLMTIAIMKHLSPAYLPFPRAQEAEFL